MSKRDADSHSIKNKEVKTPSHEFCVGQNDFRTIRLNGCPYVDKSLFLHDCLLYNQKVNLLLRPKGFGKSSNLNMLEKFLQIEVDEQGNELPKEKKVNPILFIGGEITTPNGKKKIDPLKIAQYPSTVSYYMGKFPVMMLNFSEVQGRDYMEVKNKFVQQIRIMFQKHQYLINYIRSHENLTLNYHSLEMGFQKYLTGDLNTDDICYSIRFLSQIIHRRFYRPIFLILDAYDNPFITSYLKFTNRAELLLIRELFQDFYSKSVTFSVNKINPYIKSSLLVGVLPVRVYKEWFNRPAKYYDKFLYDKFFGFSKNEVSELLSSIKVKTKIKAIEAYYGGYKYGSSEVQNPYSVMRCLENKGNLSQYWKDPKSLAIIRIILKCENNRNDFENLMKNGTLNKFVKEYRFSPAFNEAINPPTSLLLGTMYNAGFLTANVTRHVALQGLKGFSIPNKEIKQILKRIKLK